MASNIDFLRFSSYSIKELITRKLSEDTKFTDQVYSGSNMSILIDVFSYMAQLMLYSLNTAAAESMFSDTKFYRNINRLVKLLGYNPKGFTTATCDFNVTVSSQRGGTVDDVVIPKYTSVDTGKVDSQGNKVMYSFVDDYTTRASSENIVTLYNGKWKVYPTIFTASGIDYETFLLDGVESNSADYKYVANNFIDVYVKREDEEIMLKFEGLADEIFLNMAQKYDGGNDGINIYSNGDGDRYYSIRLNENKQYEIKFGNGVNGQKLKPGDQLYILYLDTNGFDSNLNIGDVNNKKLINPVDLLGVDKQFFYKNMLAYTSDDEINRNYCNINGIPYENETDAINITITNVSKNTVPQSEESVEDIKAIAPDYYKLGNRLVTKSDFEYYVKNRYKDNIIDTLCQNNWEYISTFYGWLYNIGKNGLFTDYETSKFGGKRESNPRYYIDDMKLLKYGYKYSDPSDSNNVYIWTRLQNKNEFWKKSLKSDLTNIKVLTVEPVPLDPVEVVFDICAAPITRTLNYLTDTTSYPTFDSNKENYIEITITDNSLYSNSSVKAQVNNILVDYFKETNLKIGQLIDINHILNEIYNISGIERVRTVFTDNTITEHGIKLNDKYIDGICFASWSSTVIDSGDDLEVSNINRKLECFQFPTLNTKSLIDKIKVIKRSFSNSTAVQY